MKLYIFLKQNNLSVQELNNKLIKKGIDVNLKLITDVPIEWQNFINESSSNMGDILNIPKKTESKIVLNSFEELKDAKPSNSKSPRTTLKTKKSNKKKPHYFLAYVKFIALDSSHGYVYKIKDPTNFKGNVKKGSHQLESGFKNISKGDIIICKQESPNSFKVKFDSHYLEGLVTAFNNDKYFTDFKIKEIEGIELKEDISILNLEDKIQLKPALKYLRNLEYAFGESSSLTDDDIKSIDTILKSALSSDLLNFYNLSIIKWCQDYRQNLLEKYTDLINENFKKDIENKNNIPIQKLISKWSLLRPGMLSFEDLYTRENAFDFISLWANNKIPNNFIEENLTHLIFDVFEIEENKLTLNNLFNSLSAEKKICIEIFCKENTEEDKNSILKTLTILEWLSTESSLELREQIFFASQKKIQLQLYFEEHINYTPVLTIEEQEVFLNQFVSNFGDKPIEEIIDFIEKWEAITGSLLEYKLLKNDILINILFKIWSLQKVTPKFFGENSIEVLDTLFRKTDNIEKVSNEEEVQLKETDFQQLPSPLLNEIDKHIHEYCASLNISELSDYEYYVSFLNLFQTEKTQEEIINLPLKTTPGIQYQLWSKGESSHIPVTIALRKFTTLSPELQSQLVELISIEELHKIIKKVKNDVTEKAKLKLFEALRIEIKKCLNPIVFDLELRNEKITELAWTGIETENCTISEEINNHIEKFNRITKDSKNLIIGHNIIDFDCPLLEKEGIKFHKNSLWDTLLVESILSPELQTLSLKTDHNALADCNNTFELFYNQICRLLLLSEEETTYCLDYLPESIRNSIEILRSKYPIAWLDKKVLLEKRNSVFLPQPKRNDLAKELNDILEEVDTNTLIVGPEILMPELFKVSKLEFHNSNNTRNYKKLSAEKIRMISNDNLWVKQILKSYLNYTKINRLMPIKGGVAPFVQHRIKNIIDIETILDDGNELSDFNYSCTFIKVNELSDKLEYWKSSLFKNIIVIAPDLISTSNAELITTLNIKGLFNNDYANEIWMHFSGGQSFQKINKEQCKKLGIAVNSNYSNMWLEKFEFGNYRLYGHQNWEGQIEELDIKNKTVVKQSIKNLGNKQLILPKIKTTNKINSKIVRLNPETIFRKQYWVYQKELIKSISLNGKPVILLVPREEEIGALENYFSSIGYDIPSNKNSISRKIEKLFSSNFKYRLLIAKINDLKYFAHKNHGESLNFVIDSFSIQRNFYNAQDSSYLHDLMNKSLDKPSDNLNDDFEENENEEYVELQVPSDRLEKDTFFHLKLQKPFVDYIRGILNQYDIEHTLWVLDPRVNDYPDLHKWWNATSKQLSVWKDESRYEDEIKLASMHIHSPEPLKELPITLEKTKKALSNSFLNGNSWYDYQEEYLDKIIPCEEDLLISLPTGAGKSLLFQAPALFKNSFTNKLSIVVTPLKALMEDQVKELWNKGFMNNVEYINADRRSDIPMIYRSIAGGELSLLYITPERFRSNGFINALKTRIKIDGSLEYAIFDEAHCVSQWGHDFRPDYLNSAKSICTLRKHAGQHSPILLFSATVSEKIYNDFNTIFI